MKTSDKWRVTSVEDAGAKVLEISAPEGKYRPVTRDLVLQVRANSVPEAARFVLKR